MAVKDHYLFVCDLADLKIYDLHDRLAALPIVHFPENGDKIVNCCALDGNTLYITMTDPGPAMMREHSICRIYCTIKSLNWQSGKKRH